MSRSLALVSPDVAGNLHAPAPAPVDATGLVALLALENAKLNAAWADAVRELADARARVIEAGDLARRRLERDLHDGAQQRLTAIQVKLELARETVQEQDIARQLESIGADVGKAVDELRALARGIYPTVLRDHGVADALRSTAREAPIPVRVIDDGIGRCAEVVETAIYFCALEAVQNAIKHAGAGAVITLRVSRQEQRVRFEFADDGGGIDADQQGDGLGLTSMRDRIAAVNGELEIISRLGRGTTVRGAIPERPGLNVVELIPGRSAT